MAHFAQIDENNVVTRVLTCDNSVLDNNGTEDENLGKQYLANIHGGTQDSWIQTSYNTISNQHKNGKTPFRGNYAGVGGTWDPVNQLFFPVKPFPSFIKDLSISDWVAPIERPTLTPEQQAQNDAGTHNWGYNWSEEEHQKDNTKGFILSDLLA